MVVGLGNVVRLAARVVLLMLLAACGSIPQDPDGTLDRVRSSGELRVGVSHHPPWTDVTTSPPSGSEVEIITGWAESLGATVAWQVDGEEALVAALERGDIDVLIGGVTDQSAWSSKVGLTRPYVEVPGPDGPRAHVMAVPAGENAAQSSLERWLDTHGRAP